MIISWFTQPEGSNASYYQYDTVSQQFTRTRLELGRTSKTSTNDTFVSYKPQRTVGFAKERYSTSKPLDKWSVNDEGELCYDGKPLSAEPKSGYRTYDSSDTKSFVHRGNAITDTPQLPEGIEPRHLALLANEAMVKKATFKLTDGTASQKELVSAIQNKVCEVLGVDQFSKVTDEMILNKLTSQIKDIQSRTVEVSKTSLKEMLTKVEKLNSVIKEQIEEGDLTPTKEFEEAFIELQTAVSKAQTATSDTDVQQALTAIANAQKSVNTAIENIDANQHDFAAKQLDTAKEVLLEAQNTANEWQEIETEYEPLAEAKSVEAYEKEIGMSSEEFV